MVCAQLRGAGRWPELAKSEADPRVALAVGGAFDWIQTVGQFRADDFSSSTSGTGCFRIPCPSGCCCGETFEHQPEIR